MVALAAALASEGLLRALLLTRLQVIGVLLDILDDVLLLDLSLEASKRAFNGLAFLHPDFGQSLTPLLSVSNGAA